MSDASIISDDQRMLAIEHLRTTRRIFEGCDIHVDAINAAIRFLGGTP